MEWDMHLKELFCSRSVHTFNYKQHVPKSFSGLSGYYVGLLLVQVLDR